MAMLNNQRVLFQDLFKFLLRMEWVEAHEAVSKCSPVNINPAYTIPQ